jgi:hypothetical protein
MNKPRRQKDVTQLGLYVTEQRDGDYYHVRASVVTIGYDAYERRQVDQGETFSGVRYDSVRNTRGVVNGLWLKDLVVTSQGERKGNPRHLYGWEVRYQNVFSVDAREAQLMAHTLKTIERRMAKLDEKYGRAATFGAYLARVAQAIGAEKFVHQQGASGGWSYSDSEQRKLSVADGINYVDWQVQKWVEETTPKETAVVHG